MTPEAMLRLLETFRNAWALRNYEAITKLLRENRQERHAQRTKRLARLSRTRR